MRAMTLAAVTALVMIPVASGQQWEVGAGGGGAFYNSKQIKGTSAVDAKFKPGGAVTAYLGQMGNRIGGEIRYTMLFNSMELSSGGTQFSMGGRSQTIGYNVHIYTNGDKNANTRGYIIAGGGIKQYTGTGQDLTLQPFIRTGVLTATSEWKPMVAAGAGVRFKAGENSHFRVELLVQGTQAPTEVITPVTGSLGGWYFAFVPMVSMSYVW